MKRFLVYSLTIFALISCSTAKRAKESHTNEPVTFVVDENLPAPEQHLKYPATPEGLARQLLMELRMSDTKGMVAACSFAGETIYSMGQKVFFEMMIRAYAEHRPLVLTPDAIWMLISQGFSHYVNQNPEVLRDKFVDFEGKLDLTVLTDKDLFSAEADWDGIIRDFADEIEKNTKGSIAKTLTADFSTTSQTERIASQIILMDAVKPYFEYTVMYIVCGIPDITLKGTTDDWKSILSRTKELKKYGLGWWTDELVPILREFVNASEGHPDRAFWQDIVCTVRPDRVRGRGCGMVKNEVTEFDGWFLKFFPFDKKGRTPSKVTKDHKMLPEQARVPFRYIKMKADGSTEETPMELLAGLIGVKEDSTTFALTPVIGWMAYKTETEEDMLKSLKANAQYGITLRVKEVPEILRKLQHIRMLELTFTDGIKLPQWMDEIKIDRLILHGDATTKEKKEIKERFPNVQIN